MGIRICILKKKGMLGLGVFHGELLMGRVKGKFMMRVLERVSC